jgi:hypothetical protein
MANRTVFTALVGLAWALGLTAVVAAHQPGTSGSAPKPRDEPDAGVPEEPSGGDACH